VTPIFGRLRNRKEVAADLPDVLGSLKRNRLAMLKAVIVTDFRISLHAYRYNLPSKRSVVDAYIILTDPEPRILNPE
jgi:hypothetical protein